MFDSPEGLELHNVQEYLNRPNLVTAPALLKSKGRVFVQGLFANSQTKRIYSQRGYEIVNRIEDADIVVWTGGEDINPRIYGEKPAGAVGWNDRRDAEDLAAIDKSKDKFKVGICRGAQILNCYPNGGTLWQDVDRHGGHHKVRDHVTGEEVTINSLHHQQLILTDKAELVASCNLATEKYGYNSAWHKSDGKPDVDVEVAYYPETRSLLYQAHPEFGHSGTTEYFFSLMDRYYEAA